MSTRCRVCSRQKASLPTGAPRSSKQPSVRGRKPGGGLRVHLAVAAAGGDHLALPQPRAQAKPHGCQLSHQQVEEARHGAPVARQGAVVEEEESQVQGALVRGGGLAEGSLGGALQC